MSATTTTTARRTPCPPSARFTARCFARGFSLGWPAIPQILLELFPLHAENDDQHDDDNATGVPESDDDGLKAGDFFSESASDGGYSSDSSSDCTSESSVTSAFSSFSSASSTTSFGSDAGDEIAEERMAEVLEINAFFDEQISGLVEYDAVVAEEMADAFEVNTFLDSLVPYQTLDISFPDGPLDITFGGDAMPLDVELF